MAEVSADDGWHYRVWQGASGRFVAECKRQPFQFPAADYGLVLAEQGPLYFEFGDTPEAALANLKASYRDERVQ